MPLQLQITDEKSPKFNQDYGEETPMSNIDIQSMQNAKLILANLKRISRFNRVNQNKVMSNELTTRKQIDEVKGTKQLPKEFKLTTKMSKEMKESNNSVIKVLNTLNLTNKYGAAALDQAGRDSIGLEQMINID